MGKASLEVGPYPFNYLYYYIVYMQKWQELEECVFICTLYHTIVLLSSYLVIENVGDMPCKHQLARLT